ncbi:MAG: NADH-quinone oxidoreductase subunit C [Armatimonadetes bacterium]|nr:NADH-quinone oxidoreductase subunit C [Armatimonadota bacterium]
MRESNADEKPVEGEETPAPEPLPEDLAAALGDSVLEFSVSGARISLTVKPEAVADVCRILRDREAGPYLHLASLLGVDYGDDLGVVYHLYELRGPARVAIHVRLPRAKPSLPSIVGVFPAADWKEREATEMFGIAFDGHPDPRNLLLPEDWEGHPLRKDYVYPDHPFLAPDPRHELA